MSSSVVKKKNIINSTFFHVQNAEKCISELLDFKIFSARVRYWRGCGFEPWVGVRVSVALEFVRQRQRTSLLQTKYFNVSFNLDKSLLPVCFDAAIALPIILLVIDKQEWGKPREKPNIVYPNDHMSLVTFHI